MTNKAPKVASTPAEPTINKDTAIRNISQWLYVNSVINFDAKEFRTDLLKMIEWNIKHIK